MKEINKYIKKETKEFRRKSILHSKSIKENTIILKNLKDDYNQWLYDLKQLMKNGCCRQAIKEIEEKKYKFKLIPNELWKIRIIKAKAILNIIKIKMRRHPQEIILENSSQNRSLKFWFNLIFLTLEELILEFRYDINPHMDYSSKKIIEPVQTLIACHIEYIYYLCIFSIKTNEIIPLLTYLSIADRFTPFIPFMSQSKLLNYFQNIILLKIKLFIENCSFIPALQDIEVVFNLCFREMHLFLSFDSQINLKTLNGLNTKNKKQNKNIFGFCEILKKIIYGYFLRGVACEHLGYFDESIKAYKECRWYSNKYLFDYNKELFKIFRNIERKFIIYKQIFEDIHNQFLFKNKNENEGKQKKKLFINKRYYISSSRNNRHGAYNTINTNKSRYKSAIRLRDTSLRSVQKKEKLEKLLKNIGKSLYKVEENRNNNILKKFTKNSFVLSTVKMINNLLSDPFNHILKKMEKIEITKPQDEINHLINWTIYFQRQKEFKHLMKKKENYKKVNFRNKSCNDLDNLKNSNISITKSKETIIKLPDNMEIIKEEKSDRENNKNCNQSQNIKIKMNQLNHIFKFKPIISSSKINNRSNKNFQRTNQKILRFPLNKDVFSASLLNKKNYLDSFYEKELCFQKKLLKLKGYDIEKVESEYNPQQSINTAEKDFKIIKCFAESKNTKKNLINLVKNTNELSTLEIMFPDKKLRTRSNKLKDLRIIKKYMLIHNINIKKERYEPNKVKKYNEEKSKILNMECAKLEELQNLYQIKKKILMKEGTKRRNEKKIY